MRLLPLLTASLLIAGCTPLGLWIYDDPVVALDDVLIDPRTDPGAAPPYVVLAVENRNDYALSLKGLELELRIDDGEIGRTTVDTALTLHGGSVQPVRIMVPPAGESARGRIARMQRGTHRYAILGRARVETPIGERRVGFQQELTATAE